MVRTGSPPTKERYCSMVSLGGVDTGKSNIQREREEERERKGFLQLNGNEKMAGG